MEEERVNGAHRADIAGLELIHQLNARLTSRQACGATLPRYTATTNREGATHRQKREHNGFRFFEEKGEKICSS